VKEQTNMSISQSENHTHNVNVAAAEGVRQVAVAAAAGNVASIRSAEVTFHQACKASALANGVSPSVHIWALRSLGTGGV
jgi:hypothetical protein